MVALNPTDPAPAVRSGGRLRRLSLVGQFCKRGGQLARRVGLQIHQQHELAAQLTGLPHDQLQLDTGAE